MLLELVELPNLAPDYVAAPPRWFRPFWMFCSVRNDSNVPVFVYGPRHELSQTTIPTSLYVLHPGERTPAFWDCKGFLLPLGRVALFNRKLVEGPVALKYRDMRCVTLRGDRRALVCDRPNRILGPEQDDFPVPPLTTEEILSLPRLLIFIP